MLLSLQELKAVREGTLKVPAFKRGIKTGGEKSAFSLLCVTFDSLISPEGIINSSFCQTKLITTFFILKWMEREGGREFRKAVDLARWTIRAREKK